MCLVLQGAPAAEYSKSDNNHVAAADSNLELVYSQMDAAAASKTGLSDLKDDIGPESDSRCMVQYHPLSQTDQSWMPDGQAYPGISRADVKAGKASFDGLAK